jgi:hypothetical protein
VCTHDRDSRELVSSTSTCSSLNLTYNRYPDGITDPKSARQLFQFASQKGDDLSNWLHSLPSSLAVNDVDKNAYYLPHVLQLQ